MSSHERQDHQSDGSTSDRDDEFSELENVEEDDMSLDEKDSDEEELENLVLGNRAGFLKNLFSQGETLDDEEPKDDAQGAENDLEGVLDSALFFLDTAAPSKTENQLAKASQLLKGPATGEDVPAWYDSDDERLTVSLASNPRLRKLRETEADDVVNGVEYARRLRLQYVRLAGVPAWATESARQKSKRRRASSAHSTDSDDASGDEMSDPTALPLENFLRDARQLTASDPRSGRRLRPETLEIQRTRDIPARQGNVSTICFHPEFPILLSSSTTSLLQLNHVAPAAHPDPNPHLATVQVQKTPIYRAEFLGPRGDKIIFAGRRRYFHTWDISSGLVTKIAKIQGHQTEHKTMEEFRLSPCGRWMAVMASSRKGGGMLNVLNAESMQWIAQARVDSRGGIADFAWWSTGDGMTVLGKDGSVAEWSMASKRTLGVWRDEGSIGATVLALGGHGGPGSLGGDQWVAVGSTSGILNVYDRHDLLVAPSEDEINIKELPPPKRSFDQLTTPITVVTFAPDGQILAFGSRLKKDALKMVHLPSCTVYRNWPTAQTPLGRISCIAMKDNFMAIGNDSGKIRLWEIRG